MKSKLIVLAFASLFASAAFADATANGNGTAIDNSYTSIGNTFNSWYIPTNITNTTVIDNSTNVMFGSVNQGVASATGGADVSSQVLAIGQNTNQVANAVADGTKSATATAVNALGVASTDITVATGSVAAQSAAFAGNATQIASVTAGASGCVDICDSTANASATNAAGVASTTVKGATDTAVASVATASNLTQVANSFAWGGSAISAATNAAGVVSVKIGL